ncbi:xanthine dehydrogenase family protein subunit M [bacterium]|nr:xanthine dehydrogenase family protein subunit M [bacterium]
MKNLQLIKSDNLSELLELLKKEERKYNIIAGGTDVMVLLKEFLIDPQCLYDVSGLSELKEILVDNDSIEIGSAVTMSDIIADSEVSRYAPVLVSALKEVGSPLIRNRATLGGNVGNSSPAGDSIPALFVLNARVNIVSEGNERSVKIEDFILGPRRNVLEKGEIIKSFVIDKMGTDERSFFLKAGSRNALAISKANLAFRFMLKDNLVKSMNLSFGSVGPVVIKSTMIPQLFIGKKPDPGLIDKSCSLVSEEIKPIDDFRSTAKYRVKVLENLLRKCLDEFC